jgi:acyl-CoA synthetase (AMP-forming)/AMP-acid ligase II
VTQRVSDPRLDRSAMLGHVTMSNAEPTAASTLAALLHEKRLARPDAPFLLLESGPVSFAELEAAADRLATALLDRGIGQGDRVAIAAPNGVEWLTTFFATAKIGAILVTLNVVYRERELVYMLGQSGARVLVSARSHADCSFVDLYAQLRAAGKLPALERVAFLGDAGDESWTALASTTADPARLATAAAKVAPADPAVILYTSGTTGTPKGAVLTHESLLASARAQAMHLGHGEEDVMIGHQPLNHVGGMTCTTLTQLVAGGAVTVLPAFTPKAALEMLARDKVTIMVGVPTMYARMLALPEMAELDTSRIRLCIIGGSNLEPGLAARVHEAFPRADFVNLYGMSETSGAAIISPRADSLETICQTIGVMIGDAEGKVVDPDGKTLPDGEPGELWIRASSIAAGYWEQPEATRAVFHEDGFLATGDMAARRPDGRFSLRGRKKEMYIRGGYNVYPAEVENLVATHPSVEAVAIVGAPDETLGEIGVAFVVCRPGKALALDELRSFVGAQVARYKVPDRLEVIEAMPLTPVGKIKKAALAARGTR